MNDRPDHKQILCFSFGLLLFILLVCPISPAWSQEFPCDGSFYYVATDSREGSKLFKALIDPVTRSVTNQQLPLENPGMRHLTCLGYNVKDKNLYALDFNSFELLRIRSSGAMDNLGVPENLDTLFEYHGGGMTPDGRRLVVLARDPLSKEDKRVYSIQVNDGPAHYAGFFSVVGDAPVSIADIAVDPLVGATYGFDLLKGQIVETDRTGQTSTNSRPLAQVSQDFGSLFFDREGQLYGLGSPGRGGGTQNQLYEISKRNGESKKVATLQGGFDTDGCACPYTVRFEKMVSPQITSECGQVQIQYEVINNGGIGQIGTRVFDQLPSGFTIADFQIANASNLSISSSVGTNALDFNRWTLVLGSNTFSLLVDVPSVSNDERLGSQGLLSNLPLALGSEINSDDPLTSEFPDATKVLVRSTQGLALEEYRRFSCALDTVFLSLPIQGDFLWSTGSTAEQIAITQKGSYSLSVTTACGILEDTIDVSLQGEIFQVDLGADQNLSLGEVGTIPVHVLGGNIVQWTWSSDIDLSLSCLNCNAPNFIAVADGVIELFAEDDRGCTATDTINLAVDQRKKLFAPTGFTPNADGRNDRFQIAGLAGSVVYLDVFNRLGQRVYSSEPYNLSELDVGWDGYLSGKRLPQDVYIWAALIEFPDGQRTRYSGEVTLMH